MLVGKASVEVVKLLLHLYPELGLQSAVLKDKKGRAPLYYSVRYEAASAVVVELLKVAPEVMFQEDRMGKSVLKELWDSWADKWEWKRTLANITGVDNRKDKDATESEEEMKMADLNSQEDTVKDEWENLDMYLRAAFHFPFKVGNCEGTFDDEKSTSRTWRILHAVSSIECHPSIFRLAIKWHPEQIQEIDKNDLHTRKNGRSCHRTLLHIAAASPQNGDQGREEINTILEHFKQSASIPDQDGSLPLHVAAANEHKLHWIYEGIQDLYKAYPGAVSARDSKGRLPLHRAVLNAAQKSSSGDGPSSNLSSVICNLVERHPDGTKERDEDGCLPLHLVAKFRCQWDYEAEAILSEFPEAARARAGRVDHNSLAIHFAASNSNATLSLIQKLIQAHPQGASQEDRTGKLPLHLACESGKSWADGVGALYEAYPPAIRVQEGNSRRWTPLHIVASLEQQPNAKLIDQLCSLHPEAASMQDSVGRFPLHCACAAGKTWNEGLETLFNACPHALGERDNNGCYPFFHSALFPPVEAEEESVRVELLYRLILTNPPLLAVMFESI